MAPHLVSAQSFYKSIRIYSFHHSHTHTHITNTCITGDGLVKTTDQYAEEKRWVLSFDLKEESEDECHILHTHNYGHTEPIFCNQNILVGNRIIF